MKPHDLRRLKAFLKDELEAVEEYKGMANEMHRIGHHGHEHLFRQMAADEFKHASNIRKMIQDR
ncbi:MAG: hypothetical protein KAS07_06020 [Candidatus Pacebacteria bacterium]|nr:hypothetical protein [Candidatus Paceibacterota bacterium]